MGKYNKLFHAVNPEKFRSGGPEDLKKYPDMYHFDYRDNVDAPHFIEGSFARSAGKVSHVGGISEFPQPTIYYSSFYRSDHRRQFPNSHPVIETTSLISIDPEHPGALGGTFWHWMGEGEDAEDVEFISKEAVAVALLLSPYCLWSTKSYFPFARFEIVMLPSAV